MTPKLPLHVNYPTCYYKDLLMYILNSSSTYFFSNNCCRTTLAITKYILKYRIHCIFEKLFKKRHVYFFHFKCADVMISHPINKLITKIMSIESFCFILLLLFLSFTKTLRMFNR